MTELARTILWLWTCPNTLADKIITQTIFAAQFTSGLFPHLGKTPGHHIQHLPQAFIPHWLSVDQILSLQAQPSMRQLCFLLKGPQPVGGSLPVTLGASWYLSNIGTVSCHLHNSVRTLHSHQPKGLGQSGEVQKWCCFTYNPNQTVHSRR